MTAGESTIERREDEQEAYRILADGDSPGLLLVGAAGVGKSRLAERVLHRLSAEGRIVIRLSREASPHRILGEIGFLLFEKAVEFDMPKDDPNRRLAVDLRRPDLDWTERFGRLASRFFESMPLVFWLDDFDDNLEPVDEGAPDGPESPVRLRDPELAQLLARWTGAPGITRLLVTCRRPFDLPEPGALVVRRLGPMSPDEVDAMISKRKGLAALDGAPGGSPDVRELAAGRPLALDYLDAWLRLGGDPDALDALDALDDLDDLDDLDGRGLAAAIAQRLDPLERGIWEGASVYRLPVDDLALLWQVGEETEQDPGLAERVRAFSERVEAAQQKGRQPSPSGLGMKQDAYVDALSDLEAWMRPPLDVPEGFPEARDRLVELGLLGQAPTPSESTFWTVQPATAEGVRRGMSEEALRDAHRRAASFWRFRVQRSTEDPAESVEQLLEARFHRRRAGDLDEALRLTEQICDALESWGAHDRVETLCREVLEWLPEASEARATYLVHAGVAAENRGRLEVAESRYAESLEISESLGHRPAVSGALHQLGRVAQARGDVERALDLYRRSLAESEELGLPSGMAATLSQLGALETERGSADAGLKLNLQSLAIRLKASSPEAAADVHWLLRQRRDLGNERFGELLREHAGDDGARNVLALLEEAEAEEGARGGGGPA